MSNVSVLSRYTREFFAAMLLIAFLALTAGCGGKGNHSPPTPPPPPSGDIPPPAPAIEGVATPTSVAVVTATNTQ